MGSTNPLTPSRHLKSEEKSKKVPCCWKKPIWEQNNRNVLVLFRSFLTASFDKIYASSLAGPSYSSTKWTSARERQSPSSRECQREVDVCMRKVWSEKEGAKNTLKITSSWASKWNNLEIAITASTETTTVLQAFKIRWCTIWCVTANCKPMLLKQDMIESPFTRVPSRSQRSFIKRLVF